MPYRGSQESLINEFNLKKLDDNKFILDTDDDKIEAIIKFLKKFSQIN